MRLILIMLCVLVGCANPNKQPNSGYVAVDQGKLFYQSVGAGSTPIIVLHGGPGMLDSSSLMPQMLELAKNQQVIFYDQRGSGKSSETKMGTNYFTTTQFVKDLEALRRSLGFKKFIIVGHSWGGLLAMNYAIQYPEHVSGLILMSTAPADYKGQLAFANKVTEKYKDIIKEVSPLYSSKEMAKLSITEINRLYRTLFSIYVYNPKDAQLITLDLNKASAVSGIKVMEEVVKTSWIHPSINLFPGLKKLKIPTLLIHGNDDIIPVATATAIKDATPNAEIVYIEKCGHFPYVEKPKQVFAKMKEFMGELLN